jgi:segregation and condensation protein B
MKCAADYSTGMTIRPSSGSQNDLVSRLEALLFVAPGMANISQLAQALDASSQRVEQALSELEELLQARGLRLQRHRSGVLLTSAPEYSSEIERFLELEEVTRLTRAALEVLAIVAYQQPVTRPQIDSIRGVNSDSALRTLLRHGLIDEAGRTEGPGRPILYETSSAFLQHFGLASLSELPPLEEEPAQPVSTNSTQTEIPSLDVA